MLHEVGFWVMLGVKASDDRPDPRTLVDHAWFARHKTLVEQLGWYLTTGAFVESYELAYSYCRFPQCESSEKRPEIMGACTMTDGVYCWPEGYWHYINEHHVRPSDAFLSHVHSMYTQRRRTVNELRKADPQALWMWDMHEQRVIEMPSAMQEWITTYTTIQVQLPE